MNKSNNFKFEIRTELSDQGKLVLNSAKILPVNYTLIINNEIIESSFYALMSLSVIERSLKTFLLKLPVLVLDLYDDRIYYIKREENKYLFTFHIGSEKTNLDIKIDDLKNIINEFEKLCLYIANNIDYEKFPETKIAAENYYSSFRSLHDKFNKKYIHS